MKRVAKVAISMPQETLRALERARTRLRKTRSSAVTEAVERWLLTEEVSEDDKRYVEGYLRQPERAGEMEDLAQAVVQTWEPWE